MKSMGNSGHTHISQLQGRNQSGPADSGVEGPRASCDMNRLHGAHTRKSFRDAPAGFQARARWMLQLGLVKGKTQTIYAWGSRPGTPEPDIWFHDILREDETPFRDEEVKFIKNTTSAP